MSIPFANRSATVTIPAMALLISLVYLIIAQNLYVKIVSKSVCGVHTS